MVSRVWLHEARGNESGWNAWLPDFPGFATHALSEEALLLRLPGKVKEHLQWLRAHGLPQPDHPKSYKITERLTGDEILFSEDRNPATDQEIATVLQLLECSRSDLLVTLHETPSRAYDWDPPYRDFAAWADWRTIREILAHISNTETHYYLPAIGYRPAVPPATPTSDWQHHLSVHRLEVTQFLDSVRLSDDRVHLRDVRDDQWSVRKVLRRLVRHELLHLKSIKRIAHEFDLRR